MPRVGRVLVAALVVAACACNGNGVGAIYAWSDDGSCGVPIGYVGVDETISDAGVCKAEMWCPIDASPLCVTPPPAVDGASEDGADGE